MKSSQSIASLTKALLVAQAKMGAAVKGAKNPFFKSNYADLPTVMEVVKEPLNEAGIIILQPAEYVDGKNFINTTLIHAESGEWMASSTEVICAKQNDPQAFGAAQTYARRFGLQSLLFIPAEDDDGNYASNRQAPTARPTAPVTKPVTSASGTTVQPPLTANPVVTTVPTSGSSFRKPAVDVVVQTKTEAGWQ
jgi:hypothetical protein